MRICRLDGLKMRRKHLADILQGLWLMIIYEVEVSEQADSDLRGIFLNILLFELQSPEKNAKADS